MLLQPNKKTMKKLREVLYDLYKHLDSSAAAIIDVSIFCNCYFPSILGLVCLKPTDFFLFIKKLHLSIFSIILLQYRKLCLLIKIPLLFYSFAKQMVFKVATNAFDELSGIKVPCNFLLHSFLLLMERYFIGCIHIHILKEFKQSQLWSETRLKELEHISYLFLSPEGIHKLSTVYSNNGLNTETTSFFFWLHCCLCF